MGRNRSHLRIRYAIGTKPTYKRRNTFQGSTSNQTYTVCQTLGVVSFRGPPGSGRRQSVQGLSGWHTDYCTIPASSSARICSHASVRSRAAIGHDRSLKGVSSTRFILCLTMAVLPTSKSCRENTSACCRSRSLARCVYSSDN